MTDYDDYPDDPAILGCCRECGELDRAVLMNVGLTDSDTQTAYLSGCCGAEVISPEEFSLALLHEVRTAVLLHHICQGKNLPSAIAEPMVRRIDAALRLAARRVA